MVQHPSSLSAYFPAGQSPQVRAGQKERYAMHGLSLQEYGPHHRFQLPISQLAQKTPDNQLPEKLLYHAGPCQFDQ